MKAINVLSLFDGISCGMETLNRLGIKVDKYYASEIDKYAIEISSNNYPNITQLGDVCDIKEVILEGLPKIDLILAGSPCQGFSRAGSGLNFEHKESKLFFEFIRVLNWIKENNNPDVKFLLENVEMKKEWRDIITEFVDVEPLLINSRLVSAENRPRLYWTNICKLKEPEDKNIILKDILDNHDYNNLICHQGIFVDKTFNESELNLINVVNGEVRIFQATKLGYIIVEDGDGVNLSFPKCKTRRGRVIKQKSGTLDRQCNICVYSDGVLRRLNINEIERLQGLPDDYTLGISENKRKAAIGNAWQIDTIEYILKNIKGGN